MPYLIDPAVDCNQLRGQQPEIHDAERSSLLLRRWIPRDVEQLVTAYGDPAIRRWNLRVLNDVDEAHRLIHMWKNGWRRREAASWAVVRADNPDKVLGQIGFRSLYLMDAMAEISYWVVPGQRRRGLASEAATVLSDWAYGHLGLHRLELVHSVDHPGGCRVPLRAGFAQEGIKRGLQRHDDGWHDMCLHARISGDPQRSPTSWPSQPLRTRVTALLARSGDAGGRSVGLQVMAATAARG